MKNPKKHLFISLFILLPIFFGSINLASAQQTPYGGSNHSLPGTIQIEDFDNGGANVAYYDVDATNNGSFYRTSEGVDIQNSTGENSPIIGWFKDGEWMEYTVNIPSGTYNISVRIGNPNNGRQLGVYLDGVILTTMSIPNTGAYSTWTTYTVNGISITGGNNKVLRLQNIGNDFDFNWISFEQVGSTTYSLTVTPPANGNVSLNPPGGTYTSGAIVAATAIPNTGYSFTGWSGASTTSTNPVSITMDDNKSLTANFAALSPGIWNTTGANIHYTAGNVGIGTSNPTQPLTVNGKILAKEIEVVSSITADFVFEQNYPLMKLSKVDAYIHEYKHLPGIPSAEEFSKKGQNLGEMDNLLLMKIEELTLYILNQEETYKKLMQEQEQIRIQIEKIKAGKISNR